MSSALLASILASPDDDLPRLVYADWLDENGDPARAEFIRTQIELANLPDHDPRYRQLEDREHELLSEHEAGWISDLPSRVHEWEWRRGFVDEVAGDSWQLTQLSGDISTTHPVGRVRCIGPRAGYGVHPLDWLDSPWPKELRRFAVTNADFHSDVLAVFLNAAEPQHMVELEYVYCGSLPELAGLFQFNCLKQQLRTLRAGGRPTNPVPAQWYGDVDTADLCRALRESPLAHLTCFDAGITSDGLRHLLAAPFAGRLKHLDISDNPIAPDAYRAFEQCHPNMRLDKLDVSGTPLAGISLEPLLAARSLEALTKLEMNGCGSARRNMEVLSRSAFWNQATELRAHSGTIPASTLEPLCQSAGPPGLRLLDLADNYLRTEGVRMLCEAPWAGSLTWLALSRNYLDDESCEVLAKSGRFTNLRTLHLAHHNGRQEGADGERITTTGVRALAAAPSLANLRLLTLSYTDVCTVGVYIALNEAHWKLFGLGVSGCNLQPITVRALTRTPNLARLVWLDLSDNPGLGGQALRPLAESPYLSRMCELDCGGIDIDDDVRAIFRERLGPRFSH
jgi:uncharacterized protein (TIGR02996 family)